MSSLPGGKGFRLGEELLPRAGAQGLQVSEVQVSGQILWPTAQVRREALEVRAGRGWGREGCTRPCEGGGSPEGCGQRRVEPDSGNHRCLWLLLGGLLWAALWVGRDAALVQ